MLLVTIILFPLFCLYIFIRAMQEERKEKEKWEKFKKDVENSHPYKHVPGYRRLQLLVRDNKGSAIMSKTIGSSKPYMKCCQRMTLEVTANENRRKSQEVKTGYHCVYE